MIINPDAMDITVPFHRPGKKGYYVKPDPGVQIVAMYLKHSAILATSILTFSAVADAGEQSLNLRAGKVHESCHSLPVAAKLKYSFESSSETLFNIHFHKGKTLNYAVPWKMTSAQNEILTSEALHTYCLMWRNPQDRTVTLRYSTELHITSH